MQKSSIYFEYTLTMKATSSNCRKLQEAESFMLRTLASSILLCFNDLIILRILLENTLVNYPKKYFAIRKKLHLNTIIHINKITIPFWHYLKIYHKNSINV